MPLAFGSMLGGLITQIGTPPNLIVSGFRAEQGMGHFAMFDFAPVGLVTAEVGLFFVVTLGWLPVSVSFAAAVLAYLLRIISPGAVYQHVDWPVVVLLAALIPGWPRRWWPIWPAVTRWPRWW